jgi:hypothetical protein
MKLDRSIPNMKLGRGAPHLLSQPLTWVTSVELRRNDRLRNPLRDAVVSIIGDEYRPENYSRDYVRYKHRDATAVLSDQAAQIERTSTRSRGKWALMYGRNGAARLCSATAGSYPERNANRLVKSLFPRNRKMLRREVASHMKIGLSKRPLRGLAGSGILETLAGLAEFISDLGCHDTCQMSCVMS